MYKLSCARTLENVCLDMAQPASRRASAAPPRQSRPSPHLVLGQRGFRLCAAGFEASALLRRRRRRLVRRPDAKACCNKKRETQRHISMHARRGIACDLPASNRATRAAAVAPALTFASSPWPPATQARGLEGTNAQERERRKERRQALALAY